MSDNDYPKIVSETEESISYEPCVLCDADAVVGHEGKGYCRDHYLMMAHGLAPHPVHVLDAVDLPDLMQLTEPA